MRFVYVYLLVVLVVGSFLACSPVHFSIDLTQCTVSAPCLRANGLYHVQQDQLFTTTNKVDILIVDDNSGSMTQEQESLGDSLNHFIDNLNGTGLDWQIGVTNTDVCPAAAPAGFCPGPGGFDGARGRFMGPMVPGAGPNYGNQYIITPSTPNAITVFHDTIQRGTNEIGSGDERGIYAANLAIDGRNTINAGFFRDPSNLAIVFLSDEDERSVGANLPGDPGYAALEPYDLPQTLMNNITMTWGGSKASVINSIVIQSGDTACLNTQAAQGPYLTAHPGTLYEQIANLSGGIVGSICNNGPGSFAAMLTNITGAIQKLPTTLIITLNYTPASSPVVTFNPPGNAVSWTWSPGTNQVSLGIRPADGTTVHVEYDYQPTSQITYTSSIKVNKKTQQFGFSQVGQSDPANDPENHSGASDMGPIP